MNREERVRLFHDTTQFKKTSRPPMIGNLWTYRVYDAGYTLEEALTNYDIMEKCIREAIERYGQDWYLDNGTRNPLLVGRALGKSFHRIDENDRMIIDDHCLMDVEDYELLKTDPVRLGWTKILPNVNPDLTIGQLQNAMGELANYFAFSGKMGAVEAEYELPPCMAGSIMCQSPIENIVNGFRGIKNFALDVRRHKKEMKDALDVVFAKDFAAFRNNLANEEPGKYAFDCISVFLAHSVLSKKQIAEIHWPYVKQAIDEVVAGGKTMYIFCEASMINMIDFFADVPKGFVAVHLEQDNIFEIRNQLPNIALAGGMPSILLGTAGKEECLDYAKKLVEELGEGYIFSQDKMLSYADDAKRENLMAVSDFVREYER